MTRKWDFINFAYQYYSDNTQLADTKAGLLASGLLVIAGLWAQRNPLSMEEIVGGVALPVSGAILCLFSVMPRLAKHPTKGLVFWGNVESRTQEQYEDEVAGANDEKLLREIAAQTYFLAKPLGRKYACLRWASWVAIASLASSVCLVCILKIGAPFAAPRNARTVHRPSQKALVDPIRSTRTSPYPGV